MDRINKIKSRINRIRKGNILCTERSSSSN